MTALEFTCPICTGHDAEVLVDRLGVPVHQNLPVETASAARAVRRGDLRLRCCRACGFVTNVAFRPELLEYGAGYENDQTFSAEFAGHLEGMIGRVLDRGVRGKHVVEVGCGTGWFLRRLCAAGNNEGTGFDPSYRGPEVDPEAPTRFVREFYGPEQREVAADAVLCRHVIEHVPDPLALLRAVRGALADRPDALVFFETPCAEWILHGIVSHDLFYEHCSYFSAHSLALAFALAGFGPSAVEHVFGGQYLWLEGRAAPAAPFRRDSGDGERPSSLARRYRDEEARRLGRLSDAVDRLGRAGRLAVWGAGAKGVTFLNLLDPGAHRIACAVDINPRKQNLYLPGTGHPIVAPPRLPALGVTDVIVMNPNYIDEVRASLQSMSPTIRAHTEVEL